MDREFPIDGVCDSSSHTISKHSMLLQFTEHMPCLFLQTDDKAVSKLEVETVGKKCQWSNTPEPSRSQKHRRQQQQDQTDSLITGMTQAVNVLCSSLQPASVLPQSPQQRKADAIKLMEADGDFEKLESIQVIHLFTSSIDVVDSYLAIRDKEVRTMYIKDSLPGPS